MASVHRSPAFLAAVAAIDAANDADPNRIEHAGRRGPKERIHAELVAKWIERLEPGASELLRLAGRAHHIRRWEVPRSGYPKGRTAYLRWRKALQKFHAEVTEEIMKAAGYNEADVARVESILRKRGLGRDPEVQVFEDALCLTFIETQLDDFSKAQPPEKAGEVLAKTIRKMSLRARDLACELPLSEPAHAALRAARERVEAKEG